MRQLLISASSIHIDRLLGSGISSTLRLPVPVAQPTSRSILETTYARYYFLINSLYAERFQGTAILIQYLFVLYLLELYTPGIIDLIDDSQLSKECKILMSPPTVLHCIMYSEMIL